MLGISSHYTRWIAIHGPEISHLAVLPESRVKYHVTWISRLSDNFPEFVNPFRKSKTPPKGSQVLQHSIVPKKGVPGLVSFQI